MAFVHGLHAIFKISNGSGVLTDISTFVRTVTMNRQASAVDTSTIGTVSRRYIAGQFDGTITLDGEWDQAVDVIFVAILGNDNLPTVGQCQWEYGPAGSGTGNRKYSGSCVVNRYQPASPYDNTDSWSAELQITGDVTAALY